MNLHRISNPKIHPLTLSQLITAVKSLVLPFIARADSQENLSSGGKGSVSTLVDTQSPQELVKLLGFELPEEGKGKDGLLDVVDRVLRYSVNTWDRGFMDKLTGSTNAVGVASEFILAVLNTNVVATRSSLA
jgi:glutamate decarboxylase